MTKDYGRYGADDGRALYYVQQGGGMWGAAYLRGVVVDEFGTCEETPLCKAFDPAAPSREEAIIAHMTKSGAVAAAEADLERRRKEYAEREPEPEPPPVDPATDRFLSDDEGAW